MSREFAQPYLSVVVTTRNDDHGGDPLRRLQAFVDCFDEQCRRTGLDAEVIVVEWNPPADRPRVSSLLRVPVPSHCTYRFIEVPQGLHRRLRFADVLPMFQMIAKNVGIRRARGRFILATNIDIIFANELVEYIASGRIESGCLYRVDRHDIEALLPADARLDERLAYCSAHQLRVHSQCGSHRVDSQGQMVALLEDIVDGSTVRLAAGWHVREGNSGGGFFRWATDRAQVQVDLSQDPGFSTGAILDIDLEPNPDDPTSEACLDLLDESQATLASFHIVRRRVCRLTLPSGISRMTLELRSATPAATTRHLSVFERRGAMHYLVRSITLKRLEQNRETEAFIYPAGEWRVLAETAHAWQRGDQAVSLATSPRKWAQCLEYGPLRAPETGMYVFVVACEILEGDLALGILAGDRQSWRSSAVERVKSACGDTLRLSVRLTSGDQFSLVFSNDHPRGDASSRFIVVGLSGSADPVRLIRPGRSAPRVNAPTIVEGVQSGFRADRAAAHLAANQTWGIGRVTARIDRWRSAKQDRAQRTLTLPPSGWRVANTSPAFKMEHLDRGISVATDRRKWSYCLEYGPLTAPTTGQYDFALNYEVSEGAAQLGVLRADKRFWLPSTISETRADTVQTLHVSARLRSGQVFWLTLYNNHPAGDGVSQFVVRQLTATVDVRDALSMIGDLITWLIVRRHSIDWRSVAGRSRATILDAWRRMIRLASISALRERTRSRQDRRDDERRVYDNSELAAAQQARKQAEEELARLSRLRALEHVYELLQQRRPESLHLNGCGDFQLMARENWFELRGYPEFETFSMNIDALLSSVAHYAGIRERVLESPCRIYHLEHEVGSGWTPEGDAALRRRIAERGITWLDSRDVLLWSAYMDRLDRPMIFNQSGWGFGTCELQERVFERRSIEQATARAL